MSGAGRTDDVQESVGEDGAVFVCGLTLIHSCVCIHNVPQDQHTLRHTAARFIIHFYTGKKEGEKEEEEGESVSLSKRNFPHTKKCLTRKTSTNRRNCSCFTNTLLSLCWSFSVLLNLQKIWERKKKPYLWSALRLSSRSQLELGSLQPDSPDEQFLQERRSDSEAPSPSTAPLNKKRDTNRLMILHLQHLTPTSGSSGWDRNMNTSVERVCQRSQQVRFFMHRLAPKGQVYEVSTHFCSWELILNEDWLQEGH